MVEGRSCRGQGCGDGRLSLRCQCSPRGPEDGRGDCEQGQPVAQTSTDCRTVAHLASLAALDAAIYWTPIRLGGPWHGCFHGQIRQADAPHVPAFVDTPSDPKELPRTLRSVHNEVGLSDHPARTAQPACGCCLLRVGARGSPCNGTIGIPRIRVTDCDRRAEWAMVMTLRPLRTALGLTAAAILLSGCISSTTATNAARLQILKPAQVPPKHGECSLSLTHTGDGNVLPLLCRNGGVNVLAWRFYARGGSYLFSLGGHATYKRVERYFCSLLIPNRSGLTYPEVGSMYTLASSYYRWTFNSPPLATANPTVCARLLQSPVAAVAAALPLYENCSRVPQLEPKSIHWCTSACSPYFTSIVWRSWTPSHAVGVGTEDEATGDPGCAGSPVRTYPGTTIVLSRPRAEQFCALPDLPHGMARVFRGVVFTTSNVYPPFELMTGSNC